MKSPLSSSPMERAYEAGAGLELKEEDRDNSIFVSALKKHLQQGSLKERLDTLLTDAAAGQLVGRSDVSAVGSKFT